MFRKLCIIGVGLIGGSLARALRRSGACEAIVGCEPAGLTGQVDRLAIVDICYDDPAAAVVGADLVVIATPLAVIREVMETIAGQLDDDAVVTDVGSVKASVVADARVALADQLPLFVPGHPISGTERSGPGASFAELFDNRRVLLTPVAETRNDATEKVKQMWIAAGAGSVDAIDVESHDRLLGASSHLPHMLAYALVDCLAGMEGADEIFQFAGGGFADFTRIAGSNPKMWHDIALANRANVVSMLRAFESELSGLRAALERKDSPHLLTQFELAKRLRDDFGEMWNAERNKGPAS
jgi:prephenate dehydrogenase